MKNLLTYGLSLLITSFAFSCAGDQETASTVEKKEYPKGNGKAAEWTKDLSIYEVNVRQYSEEGTFQAIIDDLDRIEDMGYGILWLMPIHPIGLKNRKESEASMGSYYSVKDYYGVDPSYGSKEDFQRLVDAVHERGMYLILDWVANHSSWDNPLTVSNSEWYKKDSLGGFTPPVADWADVIAFDYEQPGMRTWMTEAMEYWVREFDIDGYRCDVAGMVPAAFWDSTRQVLDQIKPVFMLAEAEENKLDNAFDMRYGWHQHHLIHGIYKGEKSTDVLLDWLSEDSTKFAQDDYRMLFISNHDENTWNGTVEERLGESADAFAVLSFTLPGMPMVYSGMEGPFDKRLAFFDKDVINWNNYEKADFFKQLIQLKKDQPVLWSGQYGGSLQILDGETAAENPGSVFAYSRGENHDVVVVANLSAEQKSWTSSVDLSGHKTMYEKGLTDGGSGTYSMEPWSYEVWTR
jgi:glycosidase